MEKGKRAEFGLRFLKHIGDITVRSGLVEIIFSSAVDPLPILQTLSKATKNKKDAFVNVSRGVHESLIIVNKEFEQVVLEALQGEKVRKSESLSAITMHLPEASLSVPGLYYPILKALALEGISFVEIMSVDTEFSIVFEDKDIDKAFSTIKKLTS
jgi:hypothetical protein